MSRVNKGEVGSKMKKDDVKVLLKPWYVFPEGLHREEGFGECERTA